MNGIYEIWCVYWNEHIFRLDISYATLAFYSKYGNVVTLLVHVMKLSMKFNEILHIYLLWPEGVAHKIELSCYSNIAYGAMPLFHDLFCTIWEPCDFSVIVLHPRVTREHIMYCSVVLLFSLPYSQSAALLQHLYFILNQYYDHLTIISFDFTVSHILNFPVHPKFLEKISKIFFLQCLHTRGQHTTNTRIWREAEWRHWREKSQVIVSK